MTSLLDRSDTDRYLKNLYDLYSRLVGEFVSLLLLRWAYTCTFVHILYCLSSGSVVLSLANKMIIIN